LRSTVVLESRDWRALVFEILTPPGGPLVTAWN